MNNAYKGIVVYVEEDNSLYKLDADDFSTGSNWHKVSSVANGLEYQGTVTTATLPDNLTAADKGKLYYNSTTSKFLLWNGSSYDDVTDSFSVTVSSANSLTTAHKINGLLFKGNEDVHNLIVFDEDPTYNDSDNAGEGTEIDIFDSQDIPSGIDGEGGSIRVFFKNTTSIKKPSINGVPLMKGSNNFNSWKAGSVIEFAYVIDQQNPYWMVVDYENSSIENVVNKFSNDEVLSAIDLYTTFAFEDGGIHRGDTVVAKDSNGNTISGITEYDVINAIKSAQDDDKLHFVKFDGKLCKIDVTEKDSISHDFTIDSENTETVTGFIISFISGGKNYVKIESNIETDEEHPYVSYNAFDCTKTDLSDDDVVSIVTDGESRAVSSSAVYNFVTNKLTWQTL